MAHNQCVYVCLRAGLQATTLQCAFTERVTKNTITHPLPDVPIVGNMLAYVSPRRGLTPGVEDLMLLALRVAVEHFWLALAGKTLTVGFRAEAEDPASRALTAHTMLEHLLQYDPNPAKDFALEAAKFGIIDLLAHGFILIKDEPGVDVDDKFSPLFQSCHSLALTLSRVGPPAYRESAFGDSFIEWFKTLRYLRARDSMLGTRTKDKSWYILADRLWVEVGDVLEYDTRIQMTSKGCDLNVHAIWVLYIVGYAANKRTGPWITCRRRIVTPAHSGSEIA
ncbi:hypothetical protein CTheo_8706 [Ceratobasidium theobromae]|uniref:Uncharacterized protein n=1 Tax=Ceratobasidium theobromae TaxID=1582974 RepID=A0A5N5Q8M3_9AGAM|nr:hypothetical protein CTheo_8706 [Ceratobasidium theobromae]